MNGEKTWTAKDIEFELERLGGFSEVFIPEFTWGNLRIDAALVNTKKRWIRGFEVKITRSDWLSDKKWTLYSQFCSSLSVVCPSGLIQPEEIEKPFGLLWISEGKYGVQWKWKKRPKNFQKRDSLAWMWTYMKVIETEFPRINYENIRLKNELHKTKEDK